MSAMEDLAFHLNLKMVLPAAILAGGFSALHYRFPWHLPSMPRTREEVLQFLPAKDDQGGDDAM